MIWRHSLHLFAVAFLLGSSASSSLAQGICNIQTFRVTHVKGKVVYKVHDEVVANATVELRSYGSNATLLSSTTTDSNGLFQFQNVRAGVYWLIASKVNLAKYPLILKVVRSGNNSHSKGVLIRLGASPLEPCGGGNATWFQ
jgi:hypothetical protein